MNVISIVNLLLLFLAVAILFSLTIGFKNTQDSGDNSLRSEIAIVAEDLSLVNTSLTEEISDVNNTLFSILDSANMSLYFDLNAAIMSLNESLTTDIETVNTTLCTKIMDGDNLLQTEITNLTAIINTKVSTINNVSGDTFIHNIDIIANGTGISVQPNQLSNSIYLENTGVVTVNSVPSLIGSNDLLVTGIGMININSYPFNSTVEVDGSALSTAISNLQMQNNMQQMEISTLNQNVTDLQTQINNLQMMGDMIAQDLNGTTITFNMTLMTLIMDVMTLQSQVATLQMQVAALTSAAVPPGTITPFGGTVVPTGYLLCDGSEYDTTTYAALFTVIGTMYCPGPCTNMSVFAVPDLRGRIPAGQGGTVFSGTLGSTTGAETHTLTAAQMPVHSHTGTTNFDGNHDHTWRVQAGVGTNPNNLLNRPCCYNGNCNVNPQTINAIPTQCSNDYISSGNGYYNTLSTAYDATYFITGWGGDGFFGGGKYPPSNAAHQHGFTTSSAGSGQAHNNVQPSIVVKYIIKT